jgi:hypothetical protein
MNMDETHITHINPIFQIYTNSTTDSSTIENVNRTVSHFS